MYYLLKNLYHFIGYIHLFVDISPIKGVLSDCKDTKISVIYEFFNEVI